MAHLIDKDRVVAEIKRYKHKADERLKIKGRTLAEDLKDSALQNLCGNLIHFLDTLEVKEESVSEDLGEYLYELSKQFQEVSFAKLSRIGVRVAKWQRKEIYEWIRTHKDEYVYNSPYDFFDIEQCIIELKQAMKDE